MDKYLEARYLAQFESYEVENRPALANIKEQLEARTAPFGKVRGRKVAGRPWLRPDAALCLLTLCDQMIVRPYSEQIVNKSYPDGIPIPERGENSQAFERTLNESLDSIFGILWEMQGAELCSSHDALSAIEQAWPTLSNLYGWG